MSFDLHIPNRQAASQFALPLASAEERVGEIETARDKLMDVLAFLTCADLVPDLCEHIEDSFNELAIKLAQAKRDAEWERA